MSASPGAGGSPTATSCASARRSSSSAPRRARRARRRSQLPIAPPLTELTDTQRRILIALCRPFRDGSRYATPATNQQVAEEVRLSLDAVKGHLRVLFERFGIGDLPQNTKRVRLVELALRNGVISVRDL